MKEQQYSNEPKDCRIMNSREIEHICQTIIDTNNMPQLLTMSNQNYEFISKTKRWCSRH
jgi:hypothetical protein